MLVIYRYIRMYTVSRPCTYLVECNDGTAIIATMIGTRLYTTKYQVLLMIRYMIHDIRDKMPGGARRRPTQASRSTYAIIVSLS